MQRFKKYLHADIGILTAIVPEHMEFFKDMSSVAGEELVLIELADKIFANSDLIPPQYLERLPEGTTTYGIKSQADINMANINFSGSEATFDIMYSGVNYLHGEHERITEPQLYSVCAAVAVATELGMNTKLIDQGIRSIKPVAGRMQHLAGLNGSEIIDDTYNASPTAMLAALNTLYRVSAVQKIAILGNMNELGEYSQNEHQKIGEFCDPKQLTLVATIGPDANKYLAPAAQKRGCLVKTFENPLDAGLFVKERLQKGTTVLAKGSQNGVFAEEAVKQLLANPEDAAKLVRQTKYWMKRKHKNLPSVKLG